MMYKNTTTGELWTKEELKKEFNDFKHEMKPYDSFDEYLEECLENGRLGLDGGLEIARWYAVQETPDDDWDNGSYDYDEAVKMLKEQGHGLIAVIEESNQENFCIEEISFEEA